MGQAFYAMWQQLIARVERTLAEGWVAARPLARRAGIRLYAFARGPLRVLVHTVAALVILFIEWGWDPLATGLSGLVQFFGFKRLTAEPIQEDAIHEQGLGL